MKKILKLHEIIFFTSLMKIVHDSKLNVIPTTKLHKKIYHFIKNLICSIFQYEYMYNSCIKICILIILQCV